MNAARLTRVYPLMRSSQSLLLAGLLIFVPFAAPAQEQLSPNQIVDRLATAFETLDFSEVSVYIRPLTLTKYRETTSGAIQHAVDRFGEAPLVEFFQGTTLKDLQLYSDRDYWAFVMASSLQFDHEKLVSSRIPETQFWEKDRYFLVYPARRTMVTAPETGIFPSHVVLGFVHEQRDWKMISFMPRQFESTLYTFLAQRSSENPR
jgi:hypothetical protein